MTASVYAFFGGPYQANLVASLLALVWTAGASRKDRNEVVWRGWLAFWLGTAGYYALAWANGDPPNSRWDQWVPQLALYPATFALLLSYAVTDVHTDRWKVQELAGVSALLVLATATVDIIVELNGHRMWCHQTLTFAALALWAWRLRERDPTRSLVVAAYALAQLPFHLISATDTADYLRFLDATKVAYFWGKLPLVGALYPAFKRQDVVRRLPSGDVPPHDVVISYSRKDKRVARQVVQALEANGLSVWWDRMMPLDVDWRGTIENALRAARSVVVLWSSASADSTRVRQEAALADELQKTISTLVGAETPPLFYGSGNVVDLKGWDGSPDAEELQVLVRAIRARIGRDHAHQPASAPTAVADHSLETHRAQSPPR